MTSEQEAELAQRRLQNAIAFDSGCVNSAKKVAFIDVLAENERLKEAIRRLADQDATLSVVGGNVTVTLDATLTTDERWAIEAAIAEVDYEGKPPSLSRMASILRGLLARTGSAQANAAGAK